MLRHVPLISLILALAPACDDNKCQTENKEGFDFKRGDRCPQYLGKGGKIEIEPAPLGLHPAASGQSVAIDVSVRGSEGGARADGHLVELTLHPCPDQPTNGSRPAVDILPGEGCERLSTQSLLCQLNAEGVASFQLSTSETEGTTFPLCVGATSGAVTTDVAISLKFPLDELDLELVLTPESSVGCGGTGSACELPPVPPVADALCLEQPLKCADEIVGSLFIATTHDGAPEVLDRDLKATVQVLTTGDDDTAIKLHAGAGCFGADTAEHSTTIGAATGRSTLFTLCASGRGGDAQILATGTTAPLAGGRTIHVPRTPNQIEVIQPPNSSTLVLVARDCEGGGLTGVLIGVRDPDDASSTASCTTNADGACEITLASAPTSVELSLPASGLTCTKNL